MKMETNIVIMQMSAKEGTKKFGEKAVAAIVKYYRQIYKWPM